MTDSPPTVTEIALAALLHDIGKLLQRAHPTDTRMPEAVRAREAVVLPTARDGRHTHQHALWSDAFFQWMEDEGLLFPTAINRNRVRDLAVFHHRPTDGPSHIITEADRLASGQDRKARDEQAEADPAERRAFREKSLLSLSSSIDLGLGAAASCFHAARPLETAALFPGPADPASQPAHYAALWSLFRQGFSTLCAGFPGQPVLFEQGLLALSEQLLWAVPSSTIDQPDVPLHDHARAVAAIATCLFLYHRARDELANEAAIHDRATKKFRILEGDLSGIQASLFRLKSEQVKGASRILRARSFLIAATAEAAALLCREELGLPASVTLLSAGGRFRLLLPALDGLVGRIAALRNELDRWMAQQWTGDLAIILALTEPFSPSLLHHDHVHELAALSSAALDRAKLSPLAGLGDPVLHAPFNADGACATCGARPATCKDSGADLPVARCLVCHQAHEIGADLPHAIGWRFDRLGAFPSHHQATFFDRYGLTILRAPPLLPSGADRSAVALAAAVRDETPAPSFLGRFIANHVPLLANPADPRYAGLAAEAASETRSGGLKTFEHLALDAREILPNGQIVGRAMLGVLKADVDRLGLTFGHALGADRTTARLAVLSRMVDGFFSGYLPSLLRARFPDTYTVYAGGDDLLLLAPWFQAIRLAAAIRADFSRFANASPSLTLSAGIAFIHPNEPLNRAVREAEARLEEAKDPGKGKDRISLIAEQPISWRDLDLCLDQSEQLNELIRAGDLSVAFLYRMLGFWADREETENRGSLRKVMWRARFSYHLARLVERTRAARKPDPSPLLCRIMGLTGEANPPAPVPISIALWRNR